MSKACLSPASRCGRSRLRAGAWAALVTVYVGLVIAFSAAQPLGAPPDELAHIQYTLFLADHHRLPLWEPLTGGEGGYESQHPPVFYATAAALYELTAPVGTVRTRWALTRGLNLLCGLVLLLACRAFFREALPGREGVALAATGLVMFLPTVLFYSSHVNPDLMVVMWAALVLWIACRARWQPGNLRLSALLGLLCGLAVLTKLSAAPLLPVALAAQWPWRGGPPGRERRSVLHGWLVTGLVFILACDWYFAMNAGFYGQFTLHTQPPVASALAEGLGTHSLLMFARLVAVNTYLSTWAPIPWLDVPLWFRLCYGAISLFVLIGLAGLIVRRGSLPDPRLRFALNLSGLLLGLIVLGHQSLYWLSDLNFNMGGRYLMVAMPAIVLLLVAGIGKWGTRAWSMLLPLWIAVLLLANAVGLYALVRVINPEVAPGWQPFHFYRTPDRLYPGQEPLNVPLPPGAD